MSMPRILVNITKRHKPDDVDLEIPSHVVVTEGNDPEPARRGETFHLEHGTKVAMDG